jgi:uroporphyrinogen decarboxylase
MPDMTFRERFLNTYHYRPVDRIPDMEFGYWDENYDVWHRQGLPEWVVDEDTAYQYFNVDRPRNWGMPFDRGMQPAFEEAVLEETGEHRIERLANGVVQEVPLDGHSTIPRFIEFPVKNRNDFEAMKERYRPDDPGRYPKPEDLPAIREQYAERDGTASVGCGGFYGWLRNWMGVENTSRIFYDDPELVHEMFDWMADFVLELITRTAAMLDLPDLTLDLGTWWEDMCYRGGPLISPAMFREFELPRYRRVTALLRERFGCELNWVDCDGNVNELAPLFLEGGVNIMFPVEIAAGTDPDLLRERHGKEMLFLGAVNKRELMKDRAAIDAELDRLRPLLDEGGLIPHVDHRCPPDVPLDNYRYYRDQKQKLIGKV